MPPHGGATAKVVIEAHKRQEARDAAHNNGATGRRPSGEFKSNKTSVLSYVKSFEDKTAKQQYEQHHAQASTCLPSTQEGQHPALVLIRQKGLSCSHVCQDRVNNTAGVLRRIEELKVSIKIEVEDQNHDGRIDQAEFRTLLCDVIHDYAGGWSQDLVEEHLDLLMHFVPLDKDGLVADELSMLKSKLKLVLVLWSLACNYHEHWTARLRIPLRKVQLLNALTELNDSARVEMREALWIREKFWSIPCESHMEETKLLLCVAYWYSAPQARPVEGLNRQQLILRIELERRLWNGLHRFILWAGVFVLLAVALIMAGELENCRGIKGNLETQLQLSEASGVTTMSEVISFVKEFSKRSARLAPLSRVYFGGGHVWRLQDDLRAFSSPVPLPQLMEPDPNDEDVSPAPFQIGSSFTLQAWVQFDDVALPRHGVSLLRKGLALSVSDVDASRLSCWKWHFPPALSYGAHDYGSSVGNPETGLQEEYVSADYPPEARQERVRSVLHTLLVTQTHVTFMVDDQILSQKVLPRPVTDCTSLDITMGDQGLTLASVRFYPRAMLPPEVTQIFRAGSTWKDIGRVISPQKMKAMTEISTATKELREVINLAEETSRNVESATWSAAKLTSAAVLSRSALTPYINTNHSITARLADPATGNRYWEVYTSPLYTDARSKNLAPGLSLPPAPGRSGFSLSAWLKMDSRTGSGYFMALAMPLFDQAQVAAGTTSNPSWTGWSNMCWMIWVGSSYTGFYTKSAAPGSSADGPTYFVHDMKGPEAWQFSGKSYRHFVFQVAPEDPVHPLRVCIDGVCTGKEEIDNYAEYVNQSWPPAASCAQSGIVQGYSSSYAQDVLDQTRLYLNRRPLDSFPMVGYQMQTKYFDRVLTEAEVQRLFKNDPDPDDSAGRPIRETVGCKLPTELRDDPTFRDDFGNDCYWYFQNKRERAAVCFDPVVKEACPVACEAFEVCWGQEPINGSVFQIWRQQMEFRTRGASGTMCVAQSTTPEAEAIKCGLNSPDFANCYLLKAAGAALDCGPVDCSMFADDRDGLVQCLGNTRWVPDSGQRFDYFVPCKDIILLDMPACRWDDSGLDAVAAEINASHSWSLSFWYESLTSDYCASPQVRLLDGEGGTFSWMGPMSGLVEDVAAGPAWLPGCSPEAWLSHGSIGSLASGYRGGTAGYMSADVTAPHAKPGSKHFALISRLKDDSLGIHIDARQDVASMPSGGLRPILGDRNFLRVINVVGDVRMSPMILRSYSPSVGEIGHMRFSGQVSQDQRVGPVKPLQQQLEQKLVRKPSSYAQKTMLLIPPLLLQKRSKAGACGSALSQRIVSTLYEQSMEDQCSSPYKCPGYSAADVYSCPSLEEDQDGEHFGHPTVQIGEEKFFMEYLASIAENAVLVRNELQDGQRQMVVRRTDTFLDTLTKDVELLALFFSVEFEIATMLRIKFDTSKGRVIILSIMENFIAVRGSHGSKVIGLLVACLVILFFIIVDMVPSTRKQIKVYKALKKIHWSSMLESAGDCFLGIFSFIMVLMQLLQIRDSADNMEDFIVSLASFDWDRGANTSLTSNHQEDLTQVKQDFMNVISTMQDEFNHKSNIHAASTVLSIILLLRVVYCTSAHPRIELITKTIELAASDLMHFFALLVIIFFGFAVLGTWLFGAQRAEFGTPVMAFFTLCDCVLGPPGNLPIMDPDNSVVEMMYVFLFHFLCFFFMLNFILAIIVDSYTRVMEGVRECVVDQNICLDIVSIWKYQFKLCKNKFPLRRVIQSYLKGLDTKVVTVDDMWGNEHEAVEIFPTQQAAQAWFNHYSSYGFLVAEQELSGEPAIGDLAMIMALTMHKVELLQTKLEERDMRESWPGSPISAKRSGSSRPRIFENAAESGTLPAENRVIESAEPSVNDCGCSM